MTQAVICPHWQQADVRNLDTAKRTAASLALPPAWQHAAVDELAGDSARQDNLVQHLGFCQAGALPGKRLQLHSHLQAAATCSAQLGQGAQSWL